MIINYVQTPKSGSPPSERQTVRQQSSGKAIRQRSLVPMQAFLGARGFGRGFATAMVARARETARLMNFMMSFC